MSSFDRLKRLTVSSKEVENPYTAKGGLIKSKIPTTSTNDKMTDEEKIELQNSILTNQNAHLAGRVLTLEKDLKQLKEDLASLYCMIMEPDNACPVTAEDAREVYSTFQVDERHLNIRKISGKI